MTIRTRLRFCVFGTEFCTQLAAVGLFQALPKDFAVYAAVRGIARHDGLSLAASNTRSAAVAHVETTEQDGVGVFSIPHAQVKAILAVFKRKLPKDVSADEYVLEVTVTEQTITIKDVSVLFDGDTLTIAVPSVDDLEYGDETDDDRAMGLFTAFTRLLDEDVPLDLTSGVFFSPVELARITRAATLLGTELHLHPVGRRVIAPLATDFTAVTTASIRDKDASGDPPYIDAKALDQWRDRLREISVEGVF